MVVEDDVDLDTLQAQINMSLSFAHSLVSSWIEPTRFAHSRPSGASAMQSLEEELRRPPRLGVGASIPVAPPLAHEASHLKRRLEKNGVKNEGPVAKLQLQDPKSDDEERKGRPAKRKTNVDPFGREGSNKKRRANLERNLAPVENTSKYSGSLQSNLTPWEPQKHSQGDPFCSTCNLVIGPLPEPSSGKERQRIGPSDQWAHVTERQQSTTLSPSLSTSIQATFPSLTASAIPSISETSREISVPVPGNIRTESSRLRNNSIPMPDNANPLGIPLLNLEGPPELTVHPGNASELNKKRKRRRRKKKKTLISGNGT